MEIFSGFGIHIFDRAGRYFVRYDTGHFATEMTECEITKQEAERAQLSENDAYQVLLATQQASH